jgi:hypothetical protein
LLAGKKYLEKEQNYTPKEQVAYLRAFEVKFDLVYDDVRHAMKELKSEDPSDAT